MLLSMCPRRGSFCGGSRSLVWMLAPIKDETNHRHREARLCREASDDGGFACEQSPNSTAYGDASRRRPLARLLAFPLHASMMTEAATVARKGCVPRRKALGARQTSWNTSLGLFVAAHPLSSTPCRFEMGETGSPSSTLDPAHARRRCPYHRPRRSTQPRQPASSQPRQARSSQAVRRPLQPASTSHLARPKLLLPHPDLTIESLSSTDKATMSGVQPSRVGFGGWTGPLLLRGHTAQGRPLPAPEPIFY